MHPIFVVLILVALFLLLTWNNRRNKEKLYNRKGRNFRDNYMAKKKDILGEDSSDKK